MNTPAVITPLDRHHRMHAYEIEATRRALDSLLTVPDGRRATPAYQRALELVPHVQLARRVWLSRLKGEPYDMPVNWFPAWSVDQSRADAADVDRLWGAYLAALRPADLAREIRYTSADGQGFASVIDDVLTHVFNHSTYHRGQIARLVSECGGKRAVTDFIAVTRRAT